MASSVLKVGDAFLLPTPPNGNHLFIAIATTSCGKYLCVNITTLQSNSSDTSCILKPGLGVPSFITRPSVVAYKYARDIDAATISSLIASNQCIRKGFCSQDTLNAIQQGALASRRLPNKYKQIVRDFLGLF